VNPRVAKQGQKWKVFKTCPKLLCGLVNDESVLTDPSMFL